MLYMIYEGYGNREIAPVKLLPFPWKIAPNKFPPKLGLG